MRRGPKPRPASERFWAKVQKSDGCWLWTGKPSGAGYGQFSGPSRRAHRFAYQEAGGEIEGVVIGHTCDTRLCVRNDDPGVYAIDGIDLPRFGHLFGAPDRTANNRDMVSKDRHGRGERNGHAKLTADDVRMIRDRVAGGAQQKALATELGISKGAMSQIVNRITWKHVP